MTRVLVLGGSASGKSGFAESLLAGEPAVEYVATASAREDDPEWTARIAAHRTRRQPQWRTVEGADVAHVLRSGGPAVLVDSITTWLGAILDDADLAGRTADLCTAWSASARHVVAVSDEVGSSVVPPTTAGRRFRDELGRLNQQLAAAADRVYLVVAGLPVQLK
jgi:adenosylcobinamide kinase/adenosylcobinamide-phosphate guanylyltransferase